MERTRRLTILEKRKDWPIEPALRQHFLTEPGSEMTAEEVLVNPNITLYFFDFEAEAAIFVELPDSVRPEQASFYYAAQYDHAVGLVSMPLTEFFRVSDHVALPPKPMIFVHSVGRCGSTMVSKALGALPEVHSISEPDDLTQIAFNVARLDGTAHPAKQLVRSSLRWHCKPRHGKRATRVAIKPRSEVMCLAEAMIEAFPDSRNVFLYRDGLSWAESVFRLSPPEADHADVEIHRKHQSFWATKSPLVAAYASEASPLNLTETRMLHWCEVLEEYLRLLSCGHTFFATRYNELADNPKAILHKLLDFSGIEVNDWTPIDKALERDSQEGTVFDRKSLRARQTEFPGWLRESAVNIVKTRPLLGQPDVILPGTILS